MAGNDQGDMFANLRLRFGEGAPDDSDGIEPPETWRQLATRGVVRWYRDHKLPPALIETLCALALTSPTKSDLQQRDILIVEDPTKRQRINDLLADQDWLPGCPHLLVFLGNNRRQRQIQQWRDKPFPNDHLDAFFNASVDASIALSTFVVAAEAAGLGCCPISVIRNHAAQVSEILQLPDHVFPVAGLGLGWPARDHWISLRLPLSHTVHRDSFNEDGVEGAIDAYDARRRAMAPYRKQRDTERFGEHPAYGWSEDKARQYAVPERTDWGDFVRRKGFKLD